MLIVIRTHENGDPSLAINSDEILEMYETTIEDDRGGQQFKLTNIKLKNNSAYSTSRRVKSILEEINSITK